MPRVDVVIPCYNYARYLKESVASVLGQQVRDVRILIIDDASSDDSAAVATALAETDRRIEVISHRENWGHIRTYNQGIEWATADYFLLLSADDLLAPGALGRAIEIMDRNRDIVLVHGRGIEWHDHLPFPRIAEQPSYDWRRQDLVGAICAAGRNLVCTPTAIVRTSVQKAVGGYRPTLPHSGDMEMWLRVAARGPVASIDNVSQAVYRKHLCNMSHSYLSNKLNDCQERKKALDSFFDLSGRRHADASALRAQAYRALAKEIYWSGVAQVCRGNVRNGRQLLQLCFALSPKLRYLPPLARLARLWTFRGRLVSTATAAATILFGRRA